MKKKNMEYYFDFKHGDVYEQKFNISSGTIKEIVIK